jgi:DNA-binding beta-propeller fold protein YncE
MPPEHLDILPTLTNPYHCPNPPPSLRWVLFLFLVGLTWVPAAHAVQITGLESPNSFIGDPLGKDYFISNINGEPEGRDNNGFITKLDTDGKVTSLKFIQGGSANVLLHAPKGLALVGHTLYVADLDELKGFDKDTGKLLITVSFPASATAKPVSLTDVTAGPDGLLYASDQQSNTIYRIETEARNRVSLFIHDDRLAGPAGIAVHPKTNHVIAVSWEKGKIFDMTPEGQLTELVSNGFFTSRFQNLSGIDFDRWGNMYVSDFTKGKIWRMTRDNRFQVIAEYLPAPADISIQRSGNLILVPYHYAHTAEMNGLEAPSDGTPKAEKRTLADYGFVPPPAKSAPQGAAKP